MISGFKIFAGMYVAMIGVLLGAQFALKKGVGYVKALFLVVTAILIIKNLYDFIVQ